MWLRWPVESRDSSRAARRAVCTCAAMDPGFLDSAALDIRFLRRKDEKIFTAHQHATLAVSGREQSCNLLAAKFGNPFPDDIPFGIEYGNYLSGRKFAVTRSHSRDQQAGLPVEQCLGCVCIDGGLAAHGGGKSKPTPLAGHARSGQKKRARFFTLKYSFQNAGRFSVGNYHHASGLHGDFGCV